MISKIEMNLDSYIRKYKFLEVVDMQHLTPHTHRFLGEWGEVRYLIQLYINNHISGSRQRLFSGVSFFN
jgi:hypothetical protein